MWLPVQGPPASQPTRAELSGIPAGPAGAVVTMRKMRELVRAAVRDPSQRIRERSLAIVGNTPYVEQVRRLQSWVQGNIAYIHDPPDVELVQTPEYTLSKRAGDCDDQAALLAAMLTATGHPAQFVAVGLNGAPLSHVLTQTLIGRQWVAAETIQPRPLGWMPNGVTSHYILKV